LTCNRDVNLRGHDLWLRLFDRQITIRYVTSSPPPLDYAPPPRWHQHKRIRLALILGILLGGALATWHWWPQIKGKVDQARLLYRQHGCLVYEPPADSIVYDENHDSAAALLGRRGYFAFERTGDSDRTIAGYLPEPLQALCDLRNTGRPSGSVLFLHERVSDNGKHWLVVLYYDCNLMVHPACWYSTRTLANWTDDLGTSNWGEAGCEDTRPDPKKRGLRIYAGQASPTDGSRFTLTYELAGRRGMIDGRVRDDGSVVVTPISGPAVGVWDVSEQPPWARKPLD